jgi:hypothetical protein
MANKLEFPQESIKKARDIAAIYKRRYKSKQGQAASLYDKDFLEIKYGFSEALRKGNCGPYLHEIEKQAECMAGASAFYLIANELDLNPKLYWAVNMRQFNDGEEDRETGVMDHTFITVQLPSGIEQAVDPFMNGWGEVKFHPERNELTIYNKSKRKLKTRRYEALHEMSEQDIIAQLEKLRAPSGGRLSLLGSEKIKLNGTEVFVTYHPENKSLSTKTSYSLTAPHSEPYRKSEVYKLETLVSDDGKFDFREGEFRSYIAGEWGWAHHLNEQEPFVFPMSKAENFWDLIEEIMKYNVKRKNIIGMGSRDLKIDLTKLGLRYDLSTTSGSRAEQVVDKEFPDSIRGLKWQQTRSVNDFLIRAKRDNVTWRVFLRDAQYRKARDKSRLENNPYNLVYSDDEHEQYLLDHFDSFKERMILFTEGYFEATRINARLTKGTDFKADRQRKKAESKFTEEDIFFQTLVSYRKKEHKPYHFSSEADRAMFFEQFDIANDPIRKLKRGLNDNDLLRAGKSELYNALLVLSSRRNTLLARSFHPGLRKILNQTS